MVERRVCTFCGDEIEPGTGKMYIKKDGVVYHFCKSKCFKNMVDLRRVPRRTTWTSYHEREKATRMKGLPVAPEATKARKVKKSEEATEPEASEGKAEATKKAEPKGSEKEKPAPKAEKKPEPKPAKKAEAPKKDKPKASASEGASG